MPTLETTFDYMRAFANEMGSRIVESYPAIHKPEDAVSPLLRNLKRKPLAAQTLAIMGVAKYLKDHDAAKIVAECGTGKTLMSIAACYVHAQARPFTALVMCPPHLVRKWAREVYLTCPNTRVYFLESMRNGGDRTKPHGVVEVTLKNGKIERKPGGFPFTELRRMGRKGWRKHTSQNAFFIVSKERAKLGYFWKHSFNVPESGLNRGQVVNPESGKPMDLSDGSHVTHLCLTGKKKYEESCQRKDGTAVFAPLWSADHGKIQRMAPLEYMGRYMDGWFDYAIADEMHQLAGDTAQGNGLGTLGRVARKLIALTGTLMGGYADDLFNILYRMDAPQMVHAGYAWGAEGRGAFQSAFGVYESTVVRNEEDNACTRNSKAKATIKRRPGCSPVLFGNFLMDSTAFVSLEDIASNLPAYEESVVPVTMDDDLKGAYDDVADCFANALHDHPRNPTITSMMLQTLLCYPDHPFGFKPIKALLPNENGDPEIVTICKPQSLAKNKLYAKERALVDDIKAELAQGRRVQVFATYTGEHDVTARLRTVLEQSGLRVAVLKSSVPTERRESWYADRLKEGVEVVIAHPKLVETGLDLLEFPSIYFYETGYSIYTLRQASRRSWRIGQKKPVKVKFFFYDETAQEKCVKLMGRKLLVSLMMEGKFSGEGLDALAGNDDLTATLVRELVEDGKVGESADDVWKSLNHARVGYLQQPEKNQTEPDQPTPDEVNKVLAAVEAQSGPSIEVRFITGPTEPEPVLAGSGKPEPVEGVFALAAMPAQPSGLAAFGARRPARRSARLNPGQMSLFG